VALTARRSVDWSVMFGSEYPMPKPLGSSAPSELARLLSAFDMLLTANDVDAVLRRAIGVARDLVGLDRVGIFLVDEAAERMLGTWGTDLSGGLVDEHQVMFELNGDVVELFRRAELGGQPFTVLDNCPIVEHRNGTSDIVGRGWVACTPIRSPRRRIGIMYNDARLSGTPIDESMQARAAILCSVLGSVIEMVPALSRVDRAPDAQLARHPAVRKAVELLGDNPTLTGKELAASAGISLSRIVRLFREELGVSLVEYRNRLRVARIQALFDAGKCNLYEAAREAGFGSYAQFHRVFRASYGVAPRDYVRAR